MNRRIMLAVTVAAVLGILFGLRWCAPRPRPGTNFARPGNDGNPRPERIDREVTVYINPRGTSFVDVDLSTVACGTPYEAGVSVQETVRAGACPTYNYSRLLAQALLPLDARVNALQCEPGCGPKNVRLIFTKFECAEPVARVQLKKEVFCPRPGAALPPPGLNLANIPVTASTTTAVSGEDGSFTPPDRRAETTTDLTLGATSPVILNCPQTLTFKYQYNEFDRGRCAGINDYKPYVDRAEARAAAHYYNVIPCAPPCSKAAYDVLAREWSCDATSGNVTVNIWFAVECRR